MATTKATELAQFAKTLTVDSSGNTTLTGNVTAPSVANTGGGTFVDSAEVSGLIDSAFSAKSTDNLSEGSNLYYTTARADSDAKAAISVTDAGGDGSLSYSSGTITYTGPSASEVRAHFSAGTGVSISSGEVSIGQSVGTTDDVTYASVTADSATIPVLSGNITMDGVLYGPSTFYIDPAPVDSDAGTLVIRGNLQVEGTETIVNSTTVSINDKNIVLADSAANAAEADGAGITVNGASATITYDAGNDEWDFNKPINIPGGTTTGNVSFGDNDKAVFGTTSDGLQIFNESSGDKRIVEAGDGNLKLQADNLYLQNSAGTENHIIALTNGAVTLHHDASAKLATTSTGVDVTGTVTTDRLLSIDTTGTNYSIIENKGAGALKDTLVLRNFSSNSGTGAKLIFAPTINDVTIRHSAIAGVQNGSNSIDLRFYTSAGSDPVERMRIYSGGDISFYDNTGVTQGFYWDASTQRLGLGTTSPSFDLALHKSSSPTIRVEETTNTVRLDLRANSDHTLIRTTTNHDMRFNTNQVDRMIITSDGNVGIGTSSPDGNLHIHNGSAGSVTAFDDSVLVVESSATNNFISMLSPAAKNQGILFGDSDANWRGQLRYNHNGDKMQFYTATGERMAIDSSGNVGIGTTSPSYKLDVDSTNSAVRINSTTSKATLIISSDDAQNAIIEFGDESDNDRGAITYDNPNNAMAFTTNTSEKMRITSAGNVGIGTSSPGGQLHLNKTSDLIFGQNGYGIAWGGNNGNPKIFGTSGGALNVKSGGGSVYFEIDSNGRLCNGPSGNSGVTNNEHWIEARGTGNVFIATAGGSFGSDRQGFVLRRNGNYGAMMHATGGWSIQTYSFNQHDHWQWVKWDGSNLTTAAKITTGGAMTLRGSLTQNGTPDYAEYFEWADGNPDEENRKGETVVLTDGKIRIATSSDNANDIIGVVSRTAGIILDTAEMDWHERYLQDDYGEDITHLENFVKYYSEEEGGERQRPVGDPLPSDAERIEYYEDYVKTENPNYDPDREYISREDRPEWDPIGLMGKLRVTKGNPVHPNWIKMKDISATVELWLVR